MTLREALKDFDITRVTVNIKAEDKRYVRTYYTNYLLSNTDKAFMNKVLDAEGKIGITGRVYENKYEALQTEIRFTFECKVIDDNFKPEE